MGDTESKRKETIKKIKETQDPILINKIAAYINGYEKNKSQ